MCLIKNSDYKFFEKARNIAVISDYGKTHIGCVAVYQGQVVALGCNCNKTHPAQKYYNRYRIRKDQPFGLARPCSSCMAAIRDLGIRDIYYTTNDGYAYERLGKCGVGGIA